MRRTLRWGLWLVALALVVPLSAAAQEGHEEEGVHEDQASEGEHGSFKNEVLFFVGNTRKSGEDAFTVGLDYARGLTGPLTLGLFVDYASNSSERDYILGAGLWLEVLPHFSLFAGAGVEREEFVEVEHHVEDEGETHEAETVLLGRFGVGYAYHFGGDDRWTLAPQGYLDVVERHNAWVLGVGFGYIF